MASVFSFIYWTSALLTLALYVAATLTAYFMWKNRHPKFRFPKKPIEEMIGVVVRLLITIFVPAINTAVAIYFMMEYFDIVDQTIEDMENKYFPK